MTTPEFNTPSEGLGHFFDSIWGENEGYVYVPTKDRETEAWHKAMFKWPTQKKGVVKYVLQQSADGRDVYYGPALYRDHSPTKENLKGAQVLWAEFDGNALAARFGVSDPSEGTPETGESRQDGPTVVLGGAPEPTLRVQTSGEGNQHVYWQLDSLVTDIDEIEEKNRAIAYTYDTDKSGWDATQVLRPPYTNNYKYQTAPEVRIVDASDQRLTLTVFSGLKKTKYLVPESITLGDLPKVEWVIAKYTWDEQHFDLVTAPSVEEGKRSSALMRLGFFGAEKGMSNEELYALLLNADDRWGKFKGRTDRQKRLLDIINKARQKHPVGSDSPEALVFSGLQGVAVQQSPQIVYGFEDFLNTKIHVEWAVEGLLEVAGMGMVTGPPGVGKTQFSLNYMIRMALGEDFLGWKVLGRNRILFPSLEMNHAALKMFTEQLATSLTPSEIQLLQRNFQIAPLGRPLPLDRPEGKKFLEALLEEHRPTVLGIDSLGKVTSKELNEATVKPLNEYFAYIRDKYGCALLFVHHNRKDNGEGRKPKELSDLYGSQYVAAEASNVLGLWKEEKNVIEVSVLKSRLAEEIQPFKVKRENNLWFIRDDAEFTRLVKEESTDEPQQPKPDVNPQPGRLFEGDVPVQFDFG